MDRSPQHPYIPQLKTLLSEGRIDRREFLRRTTMLGLSAAAAYSFAGVYTSSSLAGESPSSSSLPKGGVVRIGSPVQNLSNPHTIVRPETMNIALQVYESLVRVHYDGSVQPHLLERWEPSDDLRVWTLHLRKDVRSASGRRFVAEDVVWNFQHAVGAGSGSSLVGVVRAYLLSETETDAVDDKGEKVKQWRLWDANAVEAVDDHTVRLNLKVPYSDLPADLSSWQFAILDPEDNGVFKVGARGTGAFELVEYEAGRKAVLRNRGNYWNGTANLDSIEFIDLGEDASAGISALASRQLDMLTQAGLAQYRVLQSMGHLKLYSIPTATAAVIRTKHTVAPFDSLEVRKALQRATDSAALLNLAYGGLGVPGEFHHVSPIHQEYSPLPEIPRDLDEARRHLANAGYPDGIDLKLDLRGDPDWYPLLGQAVAEQWAEAGIRVAINLVPHSLYGEIWNTTPLGITDWFHRTSGLQLLSLVYQSGVPWNETGYANPEFDSILAEAQGTVDIMQRRKLVAQLQQIMQDDAVIILAFWRSAFTFVDERVLGFQMHPGNLIRAEELAVIS